MSTLLWIGFGFLAGLVVFLIVSIYFPPKDNVGRVTVQFLTALCGGFSGGFFTGDALIKYEQNFGKANIALSGGLGFALFFFIWLMYPRVFQLKDGEALNVPDGWTFRHTVETVAQVPCEFLEFRDDELQATTRAGNLSGDSVEDALLQVRLITATVNAVRPYDVAKIGSTYQLKIK